MTRAPFGSKGSSKDSLRQQTKMLQLRQELRVEQLGHSEEQRVKTPGSQAAQRSGVQRLAFTVWRTPFAVRRSRAPARARAREFCISRGQWNQMIAEGSSSLFSAEVP